MKDSDFFSAHESNKLLDRSQFVCSMDELAKGKVILNKTDVHESFSRERINSKRTLYKLTNITVFVALLKNVPKGCEDAVLPKLLLNNQTFNCLTF